MESRGLLHGPVLLRLDPKNIGIGPLDSNTPEGKAFLEYMSDDPYSKDYKPVQVQDLAERLKEIDDLI